MFKIYSQIRGKIPSKTEDQQFDTQYPSVIPNFIYAPTFLFCLQRALVGWLIVWYRPRLSAALLSSPRYCTLNTNLGA